MRETLYIHLRSAEADAPTAFCIAGSEAMLSWTVNQAPLGEVLSLAAGRRLIVLVPATDLRLCSVNIPARQPAKILQAAPYALEEQLAEDVEDLHFALGPRQADGSHVIVVVAHVRMEQWLAPLRERGLRPDAVLPDLLCLPMAEPERWSALAEPDRITVRTAPYAGFTCAVEDLPVYLNLADPERKALLRIITPRTLTADFTQLPGPVELLSGFGNGLEALLQNLRLEQNINLLQGRYSPREDFQRLWQPWRAAAVLAATWLILAGAWHGVMAWTLGAQLQAQEAANITRYQQIFPSETRIVDLAAQAEQQMARLTGNPAGGGLLPLLEVMAQAQAAAPGLTVQALQYREGALFASLGGSDLQQLETLRAWFAAGSRGASLEVQSANSGSEGVQIRIKLTPA